MSLVLHDIAPFDANQAGMSLPNAEAVRHGRRWTPKAELQLGLCDYTLAH